MSSHPTPNTQFYLHINGIPEGWTWQDLKDFVRNVATRGIWTDVARTLQGRIGGVRVRLHDEAIRLYAHLCSGGIEGLPVHVALWNITQRPAQLLHSNGTCDYRREWDGISRMLQDRALWETTPEQRYAQAYFTPPANQYPHSPPSMMQTTPMGSTQQYLQQPMQFPQYAQVMQPMEFVSATPALAGTRHIPINGANGVVRIEVRKVIIKNLNWHISKRDIENKFGKAGTVLRCELSKDPSGRSKGSATVTYGSVAEVSMAIAMFNGYDWRDRCVSVEPAKEGEPVQRPSATTSRRRGPVIANGSSGPRRSAD